MDMADLTPESMRAKLTATPFERSSAVATSLSDPIADTPMVVTLDELKPYDLNPRITRNPLYEDIKTSIRTRGLDAPPAVTRRPGESHYIIRSGGNTRLAILRELWAETKDERFFRIPCLFRPWTARGEIVALTGHLAENELHGGLTFIERALGIEKARELYERESGQSLSQSELARRLTSDGYPITQPHISRMQDAVRYLLPAIPSILYAGLGKPQIERLATLRKGAEQAWERHANEQSVDFPGLWQEVLAGFEAVPTDFTAQRAQDELIGQMAQLLGLDYDALALEIVDAEAAQRAQSRELVLSHATPSPARDVSPGANTGAQRGSPAARKGPDASASPAGHADRKLSVPTSSAPRERARAPVAPPDRERRDTAASAQDEARLAHHIVSPVETSERLQAIERTIAEATGERRTDFEHNVLHAIPVQAGGLYPISDVWYIEPGLDVPDRLRAHVAQFAREIAHEAGLASCIESIDEGIGFICARPADTRDLSPGLFSRGLLTLLSALSGGYVSKPRATSEGVRFADDLGPILLGPPPARDPRADSVRLSDTGLVKLFRLIRLARRLLEWNSGTARPIDDR